MELLHPVALKETKMEKKRAMCRPRSSFVGRAIRKWSVGLPIGLLFISAAIAVQGQNVQPKPPTISSNALGPQLVAWSDLQKPQPLQPLRAPEVAGQKASSQGNDLPGNEVPNNSNLKKQQSTLDVLGDSSAAQSSSRNSVVSDER
jgi:hypothetical protein